MAKKVGYNLGHKDGIEATIGTPKEMKDKICYPKIYLSDKELPLLEEVEVGDKVSFLCLFKVTSKSETDRGCNYDLELQKVAEDNEMKISKALEKFMGEHKELELDDEESEGGKE